MQLRMQLRTHAVTLSFHITVNRNKLKVWKFQGHWFGSFSAIKKTVTEVEGGRGKLVLFLLFLSVHIYFQIYIEF